MERDLNQILDAMTPKQLEAIAKLALKKKAQKAEPAEISPNNEHIVRVSEAISAANKALKLKSVDTIRLSMRRMKLGHDVVPSRKTTGSKRDDTPGSASKA